MDRNIEEETTVIKDLGLCGHGEAGNAGAIDVKDGRIIRIRPLHYDIGSISLRSSGRGRWRRVERSLNQR